MSAPTSALVDTHIAGKRQIDVWGRMIAAYVVSTTPAPNVEGITVPLYPILVRFDEAFKNNLKILTGGTGVYSASPASVPAIFAGKMPGEAVNIVQRNPKANWLVSDLGGWVTGLKDKTESAWTGYSLPIGGWTVIDSFARYFQKMPFNTKDLPTQILTQANANSLVLTPAGDYLGVKNYIAQFKTVWGAK